MEPIKCEKCGAIIQGETDVCPQCAAVLKTALYPEGPSPAEQIQFLKIGKIKVFLWTFFTFGIYSGFWVYKQWKAVKSSSPSYSKIHPIPRGIFGILYMFPLISLIIKKARASQSLYAIPVLFIIANRLDSIGLTESPLVLLVVIIGQALMMLCLQTAVNSAGTRPVKEKAFVLSDGVCLVISTVIIGFFIALGANAPLEPLKMPANAVWETRTFENDFNIQAPFPLTRDSGTERNLINNNPDSVDRARVYKYISGDNTFAVIFRYLGYTEEISVETAAENWVYNLEDDLDGDFFEQDLISKNRECKKITMADKKNRTLGYLFTCAKDKDSYSLLVMTENTPDRKKLAAAIFDSVNKS